MSEIKRYIHTDCYAMVEDDDGEYILYQDHLALIAGLVKPPLCWRCGKRVEPVRACWMHPHCFDCIAPPPPLQVIPIGDPK